CLQERCYRGFTISEPFRTSYCKSDPASVAGSNIRERSGAEVYMRCSIGLCVALALVLGNGALSLGCGGYMDDETLLALRAVTADPARSKAAIAELGAEGTDGLAAMSKT